MPKLWNETIATHREAVREAILDTTWELTCERGATAVTMSQVAERAGIGRATLYKYFSDVETILVAWHERQLADHLGRLTEIRDRAATPTERLRAVLTGYAFLSRHPGGRAGELAALLHRGEHVAPAQRRLVELVSELLTDAADAGQVRGDIAPAELAGFCLHALGAAGEARSEAAVRRLVDLVVGALARSDGSGGAREHASSR